ncbi:MAG: hypothetical protein JWP18_786 [Solirubrobacterales bacterium]|nr:hypothetical protein [Solirubrobacterales bacterium]
MSHLRRTLVLLASALLPALLPTAPAAAQGSPAAVTVSVEGAARTLLPRTALTTAAAPVDKAGTPCPGTSAGGALEHATAGAWGGPVVESDGQSVATILGETHPTTGDTQRWVLAVNSVPTALSPCAVELGAGDSVLLFTAPAVPGPTCRTNGRDGLCGTPDRAAPGTLIGSIAEQQRFTRARAPIVLKGLAVDPSGIADVQLRLTRRIGSSRCAYFDGIEDAFARLRPCGADRGRYFSIGRAPEWAWALPARLTRGRYTLDVRAVDRLGNVTDALARGRDRVVFTVR